MKILLLAWVSLLPLIAQYNSASNAPDCYFTYIYTGVSSSPTFTNTRLGCSIWRVQVVNLSNAVTTYNLESSKDGTTFHNIGTQSTAATTGTGNPVALNDSSGYLRLRLLSKGTGDVIVAVSGYAYPANKNSSTKTTPSNVPYTVAQDVASATTTYIGKAKSIFVPGTNTGYAIFQIIRITYDGSGNMTWTERADGDADEDNIWANRAALTYK